MKRSILFLSTLALLCGFGMSGFGATPARAMLLSGFLGQCSATATGSCTEVAATGYARQPVSFSNLSSSTASSVVTAYSLLASPYSFAQSLTGAIMGHAVYDALTGGNLIAVIPYAAAYTPSTGDHGDVGSLSFTVAAASGFPADGLNLTYQAAAPIGVTPDGSTVSTGIAFKVEHGQGYPFYGSADPTTRQIVELTGFTYAAPAGVSAVNFKGAGTLASGSAALPLPATDGFLFRLSCSVTITALTMTVPGATVVGALPTTCGPAASHELQYYAGDATWHVLF